MPLPIAWLRNEREAKKRLRPFLLDYLALARAAHTFLESSIKAVRAAATKPSPLAALVQARILVRISNDLRVIENAAAMGYSTQALGLVAGVYELAHAAAYVGTDNSRAEEWENHDVVTDSYPPRRMRREAVRTTLLAVLDGIDTPSEAQLTKLVAQQEKFYTITCMAKHGNPKVLRSQGVRVEGALMRIFHGPYMSKASIQQSRMALFHAARMLFAASLLFAKPRIQHEPAISRMYLNRAQRVIRRIGQIMKRPLGHDIEAA